MGTFSGKLTGKKVREKSEIPSKNVISDKNPVPSPTNVLPSIRYAENDYIKHEVRVKKKQRRYVVPSYRSEDWILRTSTNVEEVKRTSERQSYNREQKQQDHKVKEGVGSHNSQIRNTDTKTTFIHVKAGKDFLDEKKKRESDTANLDGRDTLSQSNDDTNSVRLEEGALHERIMSAKRGRSNDQGLSEIGAMKLIDNNPNITDLSDANRPTKLVEQLSELYDNEWTDAYEHLTKTQSKPMDQSVNLLLQVLKEAYKICLSSTNKRAMKLRKVILSYVGLSDEDSIEVELQEIEKKIYEYRTKKSQSNITRAGKEVRERLRDQFKQLETETSKNVSLYIDGCVRICWYMCIKNPPMHLDFGENENTTTADNSKPVTKCFDKTKFMSYTKHGDYIDYVVWPAVFLHCGGSIMRKGVAQGAAVATNMLLDVMDAN